MELQKTSPVDIESLGTSPSTPTAAKEKSYAIFEKRAAQDFSWSGVSFAVGNKKILTDCWGNVPSGEVCAIMGSSGAGKV